MSLIHKKNYYIDAETAKDLTKLSHAMYAESNPAYEINNPKPLFEALGIRKPLSMEQKLQRLFEGPRGIIQQMYEQGEETPEEMNDLDIPDDDIDPISPHEIHVMTEEKPDVRTEPKPKPVAEQPAKDDEPDDGKDAE